MRWMDARRKERRREGRKAREAKPYLDLFQHNKSRTKKNDAKSATDRRNYEMVAISPTGDFQCCVSKSFTTGSVTQGGKLITVVEGY